MGLSTVLHRIYMPTSKRRRGSWGVLCTRAKHWWPLKVYDTCPSLKVSDTTDAPKEGTSLWQFCRQSYWGYSNQPFRGNVCYVWSFGNSRVPFVIVCVVSSYPKRQISQKAIQRRRWLPLLIEVIILLFRHFFLSSVFHWKSLYKYMNSFNYKLNPLRLT